MDASSAPRSPWATTRSHPISAATARPKPSPATTSASPSRSPLPRPSSSATPTAEPRSGTMNRPPSPSSTPPARPRSLPSPAPGSAPLAACALPPSLSPRPGRRRPGASQGEARWFTYHNRWPPQVSSEGNPCEGLAAAFRPKASSPTENCPVAKANSPVAQQCRNLRKGG